MQQVEVEILALTITAQYGTLQPGDILRTSADFARHLVEDCMAAKFGVTPLPGVALHSGVQTSAQSEDSTGTPLPKPAAKSKGQPKGAKMEAYTASAAPEDSATAVLTDVQTSAQDQDSGNALPPAAGAGDGQQDAPGDAGAP